MVKRFFDLFLAIILLFLLFPFLLLVGIIILIIDGRPIFFKQKRAGYKAKVFTLIKFRTMSNRKKSEKDEDRVTSLGYWLRKNSIDELPALINIIKGEMSFIGPRPFVAKYLPLYSKDQLKRHDVKPGFTGYAQIKGRNLLSWEKRIEYDLYYTQNKSLLLDLKILVMTIIILLTRKGISPKGIEIMPDFKGNQK